MSLVGKVIGDDATWGDEDQIIELAEGSNNG